LLFARSRREALSGGAPRLRLSRDIRRGFVVRSPRARRSRDRTSPSSTSTDPESTSVTERLRRPPAIPLVTHDPYFSVWCPADRLTDAWSTHWTGARMALAIAAQIDGRAWRLVGGDADGTTAATQLDLALTATRTIARLQAGPVEVELEFLSPLLVDDLELLSRPVTYVELRARSLDGRARRISVSVEASGEWCVNRPEERVTWRRESRGGVIAMKLRHVEQPILGEVGRRSAHRLGHVPPCRPRGRRPGLRAQRRDRDRSVPAADGRGASPAEGVAARDVGVGLTTEISCGPEIGGSATFMIGYDDEWSIELFGRWLRPWWRRDGRMHDGMDLLARAWRERHDVAARATAFDAELTTRARAIAGDAYADLCALSWRHALAAHKLCAGPDGRPLLFSKENFSNGCIATVDVTYPSAPLFLAFNPALVRAMIDPYFDYCAGPDWPFTFAAHDLGTYPKANGQTYHDFHKDRTQPIIRTQMPVEECGNMLILVGALAVTEKDGGAYARQHWKLLRQWADYLVETGADPMAQLCTDDFSGVLASNVNLSGKATVALGCAAMLARLIGEDGAAIAYRAAAEGFAAHLLAAARDGDATRLAYDQPGTWSLKYNLVWDRLLGLGLFPEAEMRRELAFYRTRLGPYGVPLDSRATLTKPEWALWAASLARDPAFFADQVGRILRYANATPDRVPLSDLYQTDTARKLHFQARSVLGGLFIAFLAPA
jgi:hypothetical protein